MQCLLTSEIRLLQSINFSSDSDIETIIYTAVEQGKLKKVLVVLVIVRIYSFTQPVCDRPQRTVIHSTKQKGDDVLSGTNISS
jgi:hypothetical protein